MIVDGIPGTRLEWWRMPLQGLLSLSDRCRPRTTRLLTSRIRWVGLFILTCAVGCSGQATSENSSSLNDGFMGGGGARQSDASVPPDDGAGSSEADAQVPDASIEAPAYPLDCPSTARIPDIIDGDAIPGGPQKTTDFQILASESILGVYDFGLLTTYQTMLERHLGLPPGEGQSIIESRALRFFSNYGINTISVTGVPQSSEHRNYEQRLLVRDHRLSNKTFSPDVESVLQAWLARWIEPWAADASILAWQLFDEPSWTPEMGEGLRAVSEAVAAVDALHPITLVTNSAMPRFAELLQLYIGEVYDLYYVRYSGREDYRESATALRAAHAVAPYGNVYTLWGESHDGYTPNAVDTRRMMYLTLAHGGTGWIWYRGRQQPAPWIGGDLPCTGDDQCGDGRCENGRCAGGLLKYGPLSYRSLSDHFDIETPALAEIGRQALILKPIADFLLGGRLVDTHPVAVESCLFPSLVSVHPTASPTHALLDRPSVGVGVWDVGDAFVLVLENRDVRNAQWAALHLDEMTMDAALYDLYDLEPIDLSGDMPPTFRLEPGGGQVLLLGDPSAFQRARHRILESRYALKRRRVLNTVERWAQSGLLELDPVMALVSDAEEHAENDEFSSADRIIEGAGERLERLLDESEDAQRIQEDLERIHTTLGRLSRWFKERAPVLAMPADGGSTIGAQTPIHPLGTGFPGLEDPLERLRALSAEYYPLVLALESGNDVDVQGFDALANGLERVVSDLEQWRTGTGPAPSVGVLDLADPHLDEPTDIESPWTMAQLALPRAQRLRISAEQGLVQSSGELGVDQLDVLWIHVGESEGDARLDTEGRIPIHASAVSDDFLDELRAFVNGGGGLLLTGHATHYLVRLGLEDIEPNVVERGTQSMLSLLDTKSGYTAHQRLGLLPVRGMEAHPVFADLPDGMFMATESLIRSRQRSSWAAPQRPASARVILGGASTGISPPPRDVAYDVLEYGMGAGRVLALGLPALDFDPGTSGIPDLYRTGSRLIQNAVDYLAQEQPLFDSEGAGPPDDVGTLDLANVEDNPQLQWSVSHSDRNDGPHPDGEASQWPGAPFDAIRGSHDRWTSSQTPARVVLDLGQIYDIHQVSLRVTFVSPNAGPIALNRARLRVSTTSPEDLTDLTPPQIFNARSPNEWYFGINFRFPPTAARWLVLDELEAPEGTPVGINDVSVYGVVSDQ